MRPEGALPVNPPAAPPRVSGAWTRFWRWWYRALRLFDRPLRAWYRAVGMSNVLEVVVRGRRSGRQRAVLLGLLRVEGRQYLGHPNPRAAWTLNLEAAGIAELRPRREPPRRVRAIRLPPGPEREAVIRATWRQHPFPGNLLYWLARGHIRAGGVFYRLEAPAGPEALPGSVGASTTSPIAGAPAP